MKKYKQRTLALILASMISVVGSFSAENYKNSLLGIQFEALDNGGLNVVLQTKSSCSANLTPMRKDANTYVITLPEFNSEATTPNLSAISNKVSSVNIRTMPYSNNAKGYTRVTIKIADPSLTLQASNKLYIEQKGGYSQSRAELETRRKELLSKQQSIKESERISLAERRKQYVQESKTTQREENVKPIPEVASVSAPKVETTSYNNITNNYAQRKKSVNIPGILSVLLLILGCAYFYVRARNKMQEIVGSDLNFKPEPSSTKKTIKETVSKLDSAYKNDSVVNRNYQQSVANVSEKVNKPVEDLNIVDLDALFKEQNAKVNPKQTQEEENAALEDFLSGFSFDEELGDILDEGLENEISEALQNEEKKSYDDEYLKELLEKENLKFNKNELVCINKILKGEILDETLSNIKKYAVSKPLSTVNFKQKYIEELITTYAISQNIVFKSEDIKILDKLMNVELEKDFITDLRVDHRRTLEMETEILLGAKELKKPSEMKTLSVTVDLPDLTEAVKKQGNRRIESQYKPEAVYLSEGYEVKKLSVSSDIQNLVLDIYKDDLFKHKPASKVDIMDPVYIDKKEDVSSAKPVEKEVKSEPVVKKVVQKKLNLDEVKQVTEKREERISQIKNNIVEKTKMPSKECVFEGERVELVSSIELEPNIGCYLAKRTKGYFVLGYINEQLVKLKYYEELKSEKIQARKSDKLSNEASRYIVRIGLSKFVIELKDNNIKYIMDLC